MNKSKLKPTKLLHIYRQYIDMEFSKIKEYINETRDLIKSKHVELEVYISSEVAKARDPDDEDEIVNHFIDDLIKYDQTYIELLMNSTFITSYSVFESSFRRICELAGNEIKCKVKLKDLSGDGVIDKCRKHLEKVVEVPLDSLNQQWVELKNYGKMRNLIVHNASNFKTDKDKPLEKQEMFAFLTSNPSIQLKAVGRGDFYISDHKLIIEFCDQSEAYLNEVISKIIP